MYALTVGVIMSHASPAWTGGGEGGEGGPGDGGGRGGAGGGHPSEYVSPQLASCRAVHAWG